MLRPVCCSCAEEMKVFKNSTLVCDNLVDYYSGDTYMCPKCGIKIVTGFGEPFEVHKDVPCIVLGKKEIPNASVL